MNHDAALSLSTMAGRLGATLFFVLLNGFFVATEFALVKVRRSRIETLADRGSIRARTAQLILSRLDLYLSACQFGITVSSLILGWLAEPAVARLLLAGAAAVGWSPGESGLLHAISLALALTIVTTLHMTLGEQAPKIWAIQKAESTALKVALPLRWFTFVFAPLIWVINHIANLMLRVAGISLAHLHETSFSPEELRSVLAASAQAGAISQRQREFASNILSFASLEVRHVLVPRVEVVWLDAHHPVADSLRRMRESTHSRFPLCDGDLDRVHGIVHAKDVFAVLSQEEEVSLEALARPSVFVPDTQPLGRLIVELQRAHSQAAIVLDDHGTAIGMAFLEDALEEIVGTIADEFDTTTPEITRTDPNVVEMDGAVPLPEAMTELGLELQDSDDTIGGHVVSLLGRLPAAGDTLTMGAYTVTVTEVSRRRVARLRFELEQQSATPPA